MITVINKNTGESVTISNVMVTKDGRVHCRFNQPEPTRKMLASKPVEASVETIESKGVECRVLNLKEGWEVKKSTSTNAKKSAPAPTTSEPKKEKKAKIKKVAAAKVAEPKESTIEGPEVNEELALYSFEMGTNIPLDPAVVKAELEAKYGEMGADMFKYVCALAGMAKPAVAASEAKIDEAKVRDIVDAYFETKKAEVKVVEVHSPKGVASIKGVTCEDFTKYVNIVASGKPLYMYGPAGSGKSYTAKQIAEALKLDYYETSQAMFAHELKGYGDAGGKFVETAFYRAFANGGLFFLDEVDASSPEALVVLNNAIANGRFDFPVIGNVTAHPDFRVVAAGNTRMTGATLEYTARQMQDTSFKNRFFFAMVTYDERIFMAITGNDEELVKFGADLRKAARDTGISQLFSYRQAKDLATLVEACEGDLTYLFRGSVLQEKEVDDARNLYEHLTDKNNKWAKVMKKTIDKMRNEVVW